MDREIGVLCKVKGQIVGREPGFYHVEFIGGHRRDPIILRIPEDGVEMEEAHDQG